MRKTTILLLLLSLFWQCLPAQTQQGHVRTLGRPDKKSKALKGVTIRVKGQHNPVLSDSIGSFSLLMTGLKNGDAYTLQQVQKSGYELNETSIIGQQQAFSDKVPLEIVMVSLNQLQADKQRIENNTYKAAEKNFNAKLKQLEEQLNSNSISIEKYQEEQRVLQEKFERYQTLIDGLAEHYAHTDFDLLDENEREINICIENGDLERADSLIHRLFDPVDVLQRNVEALAKIEKQLAQAKGMIEKANEDKAKVLKQQAKDAEYLYQLYTIALARYDDDKAQYYIETRAELDTTNGVWQTEAAQFFSSHLQFQKSIRYFSRAADLFRKAGRKYELSFALYGLGSQLQAASINNTQKDPAAEQALTEAVSIQRQLVQFSPQLYSKSLGIMLTNLGEEYLNTQRYEESAAILKEAQEVLFQVSLDQPTDENIYRVVNAYKKLGDLYLAMKNYSFSGIYLIDALTYGKMLAMRNPDYEYALASVYTSYESLYYATNKADKCKKMFLQAADIYRRLAKTKPRFYEPFLACELVRQGLRMIVSIDYEGICLGNDRDPNIVVPFLEALGYLNEGTDIYKRTITLDPAFDTQYEQALITLAYVYMACDADSAYKRLEELLPRWKSYYPDCSDNPNYVNPYFSDAAKQTDFYLSTLRYQAFLCFYHNEPKKAEQYARDALCLNPSQTDIIPELANALLLQGKYADAEKVYLQYKSELKDTFNQRFDVLGKANLIPKKHQNEVNRIKNLLK